MYWMIMTGLLLLLGGNAELSCNGFNGVELDSTGIEGQFLRGPVRGGPVRVDAPSEAPVQGIFHVLDADGQEVATFETDEEGRFRVTLPPGTYTLVPGDDLPIMRPGRQKKPFTVASSGFTRLRIVFDTGMR